MAYFMVMGGLLLSVSFTVGWIVWRSGQWALGRLPGSKSVARRKQRPKRQVSPRKDMPRKATSRKAAASSKAATKPATTRSRKPAKPPQPWALTVWLSRCGFAVPLFLLALLLYGFARLAQFGMTHRPGEVPAGYHGLVSVLGWAAAALLGLAVINLLARWRCYRASAREQRR